jgi:hypothetical protein
MYKTQNVVRTIFVYVRTIILDQLLDKDENGLVLAPGVG